MMPGTGGRARTLEGLAEVFAVLLDGRDGGGDGERRHRLGSIDLCLSLCVAAVGSGNGCGDQRTRKGGGYAGIYVGPRGVCGFDPLVGSTRLSVRATTTWS
jgi:hypothetical protein